MGFYESLQYYSGSLFIVCLSYFISIVIAGFFYKFNQNKHNVSNGVLIFERLLIILIPSLISAYRSIDVGTDTRNVIINYHKISNMSFVEAINYDISCIGFNIIRWCIGKITNENNVVFIFFITAVTIYFVVLSIEKWKIKQVKTSLFIFYFCYGPILFDQIRQIMAVSIMLYAFYHIYNENYKKYLFFVVIASLIHPTAIFAGIVIYIISKRKLNNKKQIKYFIFIITLSAFLTPLLQIVSVFFKNSKYGMYFTDYQASNLGFGLILTLIPNVLPGIFLYKYMDDEKRYFNIMLLSFPARLAGYISFFISRMVYYFSILNIILFPKLIEKSNNSAKVKVTIYASCILYFLLNFAWKMAYVYFPYHFYWELY